MEPTRDQLAVLARLVAATTAEEIDCHELLDGVAAYIEVHGRDAAEVSPEFAAVRQHLEVCPECLEEFEALVKAHAAE